MRSKLRSFVITLAAVLSFFAYLIIVEAIVQGAVAVLPGLLVIVVVEILCISAIYRLGKRAKNIIKNKKGGKPVERKRKQAVYFPDYPDAC